MYGVLLSFLTGASSCAKFLGSGADPLFAMSRMRSCFFAAKVFLGPRISDSPPSKRLRKRDTPLDARNFRKTSHRGYNFFVVNTSTRLAAGCRSDTRLVCYSAGSLFLAFWPELKLKLSHRPDSIATLSQCRATLALTLSFRAFGSSGYLSPVVDKGKDEILCWSLPEHAAAVKISRSGRHASGVATWTNHTSSIVTGSLLARTPRTEHFAPKLQYKLWTLTCAISLICTGVSFLPIIS